jgi:hypothetical protein
VKRVKINRQIKEALARQGKPNYLKIQINESITIVCIINEIFVFIKLAIINFSNCESVKEPDGFAWIEYPNSFAWYGREHLLADHFITIPSLLNQLIILYFE